MSVSIVVPVQLQACTVALVVEYSTALTTVYSKLLLQNLPTPLVHNLPTSEIL